MASPPIPTPNITPRFKQSKNPNDALRASVDIIAGEMVTRVSDRGAPQYLISAPSPAAGDAVYQQTLATGALPAPANPAVSTDGVPFTAFASAVIYWQPTTGGGGATHTGVTVTVWALTDLGDWVIVGSTGSIAPLTEVVVPGVGYRRAFAQVTAVVGGAAGDILLNVTGA